ncbi:DUF6187 family protein [Actinophytocola sediminis]
MSEPYDTVFSLPSVDDDPDTEIGVLLMGFGKERLLAGLGVASRGLLDDPATVTMYVDQLRHGATDDLTFDDALVLGATRWRTAMAGLAAAGLDHAPHSAALREQWGQARTEITSAARVAGQLRTSGAAEQVYLVACWSRCEEIATIAEETCPT